MAHAKIKGQHRIDINVDSEGDLIIQQGACSVVVTAALVEHFLDMIDQAKEAAKKEAEQEAS